MIRLLALTTCAMTFFCNAAYAETKVPLPDIIGSAPQKTIAENPEAATSVKGAANGGQPFIINSLFFNSAESAMLEREHSIYISALLKTNLDNMDNVDGQTEQVIVPQLPSVRVKQIYLSSIMYSPNGGSVVWINNRKFKEGESFSDLTVKKISPDSASMSWDLSGFSFDYSKPEFKQQKAVKIDEANKRLTFELRPNSRLDVNEMKILSGKTYAAPIKRVPTPTPMNPTANGAVTNPVANRPMPSINNMPQRSMTAPENMNMRGSPNNPTQMPAAMPPFNSSLANQGGNRAANQNGMVTNPSAQPMQRPGPNAMPPMNSPINSPIPQQTPEDVEASVMVENAKAAKNIQAKIKISNDLRAKGRVKEANEVDDMIRRIEPNYKKQPNGPVKLKDLGGTNSMPN